MATGTITQVTPNYGLDADQRTAYCKFPDGTMIEWGSVTVDANAYAGSRYFNNRFVRLDSVLVSPQDADITAFGVKTSNNAVTFGRRPITATNQLYILVIGRWKL